MSTVNASITESVLRTRKKLRLNTLISIFEEFDGERMSLDESKRLEKYRKMALNPFSFYRGSAYLFYFDLTRQYFPYHTPQDRPTWIQGDLHFENFGAFQSESGRIVYDVNDFDEGYVGSYLYDIVRMAVSIVLVGRQIGYSSEEQIEAAAHYVKSYYKQIDKFASGKDDPGDFIVDSSCAKGPVRKLLRKLEERQQGHFLEKVTARMQGERAFLENDELVEPTTEEQEGLQQAWPFYTNTLLCRRSDEEHYEIKDIAVKHGSGTASIGLDRFYVLIEGGTAQTTGDRDSDDTVLEVKEVRVPVPAYFMPYSESFWDVFEHQGKRVTATQQAMHHEADPYLGFLTIDDRHFYVRERSPYKKRLKAEALKEPEDMQRVLTLMGRLTAKMHARADFDDSLGILPYHSEKEIAKAMGEDCGVFAQHISQFAHAYADIVERDYALFTEWTAQRFSDMEKKDAEGSAKSGEE
ncbi:DUF2252 domain-containing protein [Saccharibacillus kuerlensis]|uniref:DUF2252 domain-containing protein n=1 Tax=Saccharibacillus kuerlensis TaxID=459527 RepID=A0ABQ2KYB7_9BACL|nr:DUF2252 family protein [Saccharibacillus kuerlensis]GGN94331.1 hypothetical protein GCM10010969_08970 [Saccharibacillus kuerlensis]